MLEYTFKQFTLFNVAVGFYPSPLAFLILYKTLRVLFRLSNESFTIHNNNNNEICGKISATQPIRITSEKNRKVILLKWMKYLQNVQCHPIHLTKWQWI